MTSNFDILITFNFNAAAVNFTRFVMKHCKIEFVTFRPTVATVGSGFLLVSHLRLSQRRNDPVVG